MLNSAYNIMISIVQRNSVRTSYLMISKVNLAH